MDDLPILCTLTENELRERRRNVLEALRAKAIEVASTPDGYLYRFPPSIDVLHQITRLIELESQCCQFLTFKLAVAPEQPITLEVSGPTAAKSIIAEYFGS